MGWKPAAGTTTLLEPLDPEPGHEALTAKVIDDDRVLLDLGASPRPADHTDVVASFFTPEALMRLTGMLVAVAEREQTLYELVVKDVECVQRRTAPRIDIALAASLLVTDAPGPMVSVLARTTNVSSGGCRLVTEQQLAGSEPMVSLDLADDGAPVVAQAMVLSSEHHGSTWGYRLRFTSIDREDRARIERLTTTAAA